jgi:hypothetical protein
LKLHECDALNSFTYLTQDFSEPFFKKLAMHFLEINHHILRHFSPSQLVNPSD